MRGRSPPPSRRWRSDEHHRHRRGIIGLTTARALLADGHDVTVLDEAAQAGVGTSKANGAQLSYSFVAPLADPSVLGNCRAG